MRSSISSGAKTLAGSRYVAILSRASFPVRGAQLLNEHAPRPSDIQMYAEAGTVVCKTSVISVTTVYVSFAARRNSPLPSRAPFCHLRQGTRPAGSAPPAAPTPAFTLVPEHYFTRTTPGADFR